MPNSEETPEKPEKPGKSRGKRDLLGRFKEAWAWYREDLESASQNGPDPKDQRMTMAIVGIVFLLGLSLFAMIGGGSILAMAMPMVMAALLFVQEGLGWAKASSRQQQRAQDWLQAMVLLMILILLGSEFLPKYF